MTEILPIRPVSRGLRDWVRLAKIAGCFIWFGWLEMGSFGQLEERG
jgi:hypothetical protein